MRAAQVADVLVTLGLRAHIIAEAARRAGMNKKAVFEYEDASETVDWLKKHLTSNDAVLVKGSHGLRMDKIVAALEIPQ
jgi:UDP-N-acetylmuramoyl-tripeptide--D-alanyl-D-alanine ligase